MKFEEIDLLYKARCLPYMRQRKYDEADKELALFLKFNEAPLPRKLNARYLRAQCLVDRMEREGCDEELGRTFSENLECYWQEVAINKKSLNPTDLGYEPFCNYFRQVIRFALFSPLTDLKKILLDHLIAFETNTGGVVARWDLLLVWVEEVDRERRGINSLRQDHIPRAIAMGEILRELLIEPPLLPLRSVINKILADTVYYYHETTRTLKERAAGALNYLEEVLRDMPGDPYAINFKEDILQTLAKRSQIDRFSHDSRSILGSLSYLSSDLLRRCSSDSPLIGELHDLHRQITTLRAVAMLAEGQDKVIRPSSDEYKKVDISILIRDQLKDFHWPEFCIETKGELQPWALIPGMVCVVFENLLKNSLEAYNRSKLHLPDKPCRIVVDYQARQVDYIDEAGGVVPGLSDIFAPYTSSKEIKSSVGLGLTNTRMAMLSQEGSIMLAQQQPKNGAHFILKFT